ncbi:hypothetical protein VIGAN_08279400 [Vigna angularis var. angularis]|uniref:Uncharacterized protein n=1 Tax=Vigna angularis var. angularis TaxID=157739 RepID=A0A0S3ST10_PHAAN|nr:hypothetical protein VIGAN_08279400 [Vigna angularis var. angularis]
MPVVEPLAQHLVQPAPEPSTPVNAEGSVHSGIEAKAFYLNCLHWKTSDVRLVLEDGSIWKAKLFGASRT